MKTTHARWWLGACGAATVLVVAVMQANHSANAQQSTVRAPTQSDGTSHLVPRAERQIGDHFKVSELMGLNVRGKSGDKEIGEIKDIVLGHDGKVIYAAVSFGGFLGVGEKLFAVPFESIEIVREAGNKDNLYARIDVTEQALKSRPGFNNDNWPDRPDMSFMPQAARTARHTDRLDRSTPVGQNRYVPR